MELRKMPYIKTPREKNIEEIRKIAFECGEYIDNLTIRHGIDVIATESKKLSPNLKAVRVAVREILNEGKAGRTALLCILRAPLPSRVRDIIVDALENNK